MAVTRKLIVVQKYDSTGVRNFIDVGAGHAAIDQAYFDALINHTDESKRIFPLPKLDNVDDVKGDPTSETLNSQEILPISDGIRTFTGVMVKESAKMVEVLEAMRCVNNAVYMIDKEGKLIGEMSSDGTKLYPVDVAQATWNARLVKTTDATVQKIQLDFSFEQDVQDGRLNFILPSEMDNVDALALNGLFDLISTITTPTATSLVVQLDFIYGSALTKQKAINLLAADFVLYNTTTSLAVVIDSIAEVDGTYTVSYAAGVTAGDILELKLDKDGYTRELLSTITVL